MRKLRRHNVVVNLVLGAVVLGGGFWAYETIAGNPSTASATTGTGSRTVQVSTGAVTETVDASGSVASASTANANFVTSGTVTELDVKVGDAVTSGQVLAKVDPAAANGALATAKANLAAAKANLAQVKADGGSDSAITAATAQVTNAQASVDSNQSAVDGCVLKAPMAGTVTAVNGSVGATSGGSSSTGSSSGSSSAAQGSSSTSSSSSTGFIVLSDLTTLQATASFAESDATKLKAGQSAEVTWSALSAATATGTVASISPTATTSNGVNSYPVVVSLDSAPSGARLGQTVTVTVTVASADNVLRVPVAAVTSAGNRYTVTVSSNGQNTVTEVQLGVQGDTYDEIAAGLTERQTLVITRTATTGSSTGTGADQGGGGPGGDAPAGGPGGAVPGGN